MIQKMEWAERNEKNARTNSFVYYTEFEKSRKYLFL